MIAFLGVFFLVTSFDWINIFKEKRKNEIFIYALFSIIVIVIAYIDLATDINNSITEIFINIFNLKE